MGRAGMKGDHGFDGRFGAKGDIGLPGRAEPVRAFRTDSEWSDFKAEWDSKVSEYENFDGTCDGVMADFEATKEDAKDLYDETEEFFRLLETASDDVVSAVRSAIDRWEENFTEDSKHTFRWAQESITSLRNYVTYYQSTQD
jgi:hypothetical protein